MLYIQIHSFIHNPEKLYLDKDVRSLEVFSLENVPTYSPHEVPREYVFDECGDYDAYSLIVWTKGANCVESRETFIHYKVDTDKSIFDLTYYMEEIPGFEATSALWEDWSASRHGHDYYLCIHIYTVYEKLAKEYASFILNWVQNNSNSYEIIEDPNNFPGSLIDEELFPSSVIDSKNEFRLYSRRIETENIMALERSPYSKEIDCSWMIFFPEYEGGGSCGDIWLSFSNFISQYSSDLQNILPIVGIILDIIGLSDIEKRQRIQYIKHINKIRSKIIDRYIPIGELRMPPMESCTYDNYNNPIYRIDEVDKDGETIICRYIAKIKPGKWYSLFKERCSVRIDPYFKS